MPKKTLIIGGVAGGATAAARLRRLDENREIIIFERGQYVSFANCGLPYYIGDVIKSRDAILLNSPEGMKAKYNIDVRVLSKVTRIDPKAKKVVVKKIESNEEYEENYDELIIATGSSPIRPSIPGIDNDNVFCLWNVNDTDRIKDFISKNSPSTAAVIGGGFIGIEIAENLNELGLDVSIIEREAQVLAPLDYEMANLIHENLSLNGINTVFGDGLKKIKTKKDGSQIELESGKSIAADLVIVCVGIRPNSQLAKEANIKLGYRNGIIVDKYLMTSEEDIYAVGDVIEVNNKVTNMNTMIPLAGPANKQGRIVANNIAGNKTEYKGAIGTSIVKVFDLVAATTGINEKELIKSGKRKNIDYFSTLINQRSHAGYYPGASTITLKILFDRKGKIFGGQVVGQEGVDKRIDVISTMIGLNKTIYDLEEVELAYAPPFSGAKDPVNMLGFVASNILNGLVKFIEWDELDKIISSEKFNDKYTILDVTEEIERQVFAINNSYNIPLNQLRNRIGELNKDKEIIVYCAIGVRSYNGARILMENGFKDVEVLSGGTSFYKSMHYLDYYNEQDNIDKVDDEKVSKQADESMGEKFEDKFHITNNIELLDCSGLQCPGPIMKVNETMGKLEDNEIIKVYATDMGFSRDIEAWCKNTGNQLIKTDKKNRENVVYIRKGNGNKELIKKDDKQWDTQTIIVFSSDLDKIIAAFIIANGAIAMGKKVTMFFTFWGLNVLRKGGKVDINKPFIEKMFGRMMPQGPSKLRLSKMNMGGVGTRMMKRVMNDKNIDSVEDLIKKAQDNGVKMVACTMSMDVMGIGKEEIIDGVEYAGVATYLGEADNSNVNLFI